MDITSLTPNRLVNARPVMGVVKEFFMSSQLSQFMDQTNPLAELEHKRRLSAMGPGGLSRERAGFRDVNMHIYHDMPPQDKVQHIADSLQQADYVVLSTPRLYLSVARLPWRYPVEIRYYELLFTEQLGYDLESRFTAFPGLDIPGIGAIEVNDLDADQSFFDYEHPLVLIYRKTRDLSDREWQTLFAEQLQTVLETTREGDDPPVQLPMP